MYQLSWYQKEGNFSIKGFEFMQVNITVKGMDGGADSKSIQNYIRDHFRKIADFLDKEIWMPVNVDLLAKVASIHPHHEFEVHIRAPHFTVFVKKEGEELYKVIDQVMDVALEDLHQHKRKIVDEKKDGGGFHRGT